LLTETYNTVGMYSAQIGNMDEFFMNPVLKRFDEPYNDEEQVEAYKKLALSCGIDCPGANLRILQEGTKYLCLRGEGETKSYDRIKGDDGNPVDNIWAPGEEVSAYIYIGDTDAYIMPLNKNIITDDALIKNVELADETQKDGVEIDKSDLNKIKISFKSNFFDKVPIIITYADGEEYELMIRRIGLVISYGYLMDDGNLSFIGTDCNEGQCTFTNDFEAGEEIVVFATYYHPTKDNTASGGDEVFLNIVYDDGNTEILSSKDPDHDFDGYVPATAEGVATTSFIIGFAPAHDEEGSISYQTFVNKYGNAGGFGATVINAGYDDDKTYGGTQIGSGTGVYFDGILEWFVR
ncbi:MAG: hypothetical protein K5750_05560, partial [Eubacterium sp.]|nr:hypothetical protein [Eubacterium sp.]